MIDRFIVHYLIPEDPLEQLDISFFRVLVEPACGSALSAVYTGFIKQNLDNLPQGDIGNNQGEQHS